MNAFDKPRARERRRVRWLAATAAALTTGFLLLCIDGLAAPSQTGPHDVATRSTTIRA